VAVEEFFSRGLTGDGSGRSAGGSDPRRNKDFDFPKEFLFNAELDRKPRKILRDHREI
jgi:hypothetical protein